MTAGPPRGHRWTARAGAWLAIGTSPAGLVLGAEIAARHGGAAPALILLTGGLGMAVALGAMGSLGLVAPVGEDATLSGLSPRYLQRPSRTALGALLCLAMVGWFGFNVGLGGAGLSALTGIPGWVGPLVLGGAAVAISAGGMSRWNGLAIVATSSALVLGGLVAWRLAAPVAPVTVGLGRPAHAVADLAAFVGYVSVFAVRAPDFSVGLARRRDLAVCIGLLVVPGLLVVLAGVGLHLGTGSTDLVATLASPDGLPVGNLLVAMAVVAPAFTTTYSGSLALRGLIGECSRACERDSHNLGGGGAEHRPAMLVRISERSAMLCVALPGLVLAMLRFDRLLLPWLTLLGAMLPPLIVPMAVEAARRRRGRAARSVPAATWLPASAVAVSLTLADLRWAPLVGIAVAGLATAWWQRTAGSTNEAGGR